MNPYISVVIPAYNAQRWLAACLNSVLSQSYEPFEVIVVNDGSTDDTPHIAERYARNNANMRIICKENGGLPSARNAGIAVAKGDYICFLDADDLLNPHSLAELAHAAEKGADLTFGAAKILENEELLPMPEWNGERDVIDGRTYLLYLMRMEEPRVHAYAWRILYNQGFLSRNKLTFNEGLSYAEDLDFNLHCIEAGANCARTDACVYTYRHGHESMTSCYIPDLAKCIVHCSNLAWQLCENDDELIRHYYDFLAVNVWVSLLNWTDMKSPLRFDEVQKNMGWLLNTAHVPQAIELRDDGTAPKRIIRLLRTIKRSPHVALALYYAVRKVSGAMAKRRS